MEKYDVIVVGSRCAGASLAAFLAQRGHTVCLVDQDAFPSDTLSTHVFGYWAVYRRLGVEEAIINAGAPKISRFKVDINGCVLEAPTVVTPWVSGLRRTKLDAILIAEAQRYPGVDCRHRCRVVDLVMADGQVIGIVLEEDGQRQTLHARVVIGADGRNSTMARLVKASEVISEPPTRCAFYAYFADLTASPVPTFEFFWAGRDLIMVNPCDEGLHCVAVMPPQDEFQRWRKDPARYLRETLEAIPTVAPRVRQASMVGKVRGSGVLKSYIRQAYGPGWALVGDAAAATHPCVGTGIDHAVAGAELLAEALHRFFEGHESWEAALGFYKETCHQLVGPTLQAAAHLAALPAPQAGELGWLRLMCTMPLLAHKLATQGQEVLASLVSPGAFASLQSMLGGEAPHV